jgi:DNA-binding transcriptional LysR family regulator
VLFQSINSNNLAQATARIGVVTLDQLRIFVAVAELEHVTQGARHLNLTQSATSAAIAALEARYATKLFDRVWRRIVLTQAGRLFLTEAKAVLGQASAAEKVLTDLAGLTRGSLALAASQTVANYWLPLDRSLRLHGAVLVRSVLHCQTPEDVQSATHRLETPRAPHHARVANAPVMIWPIVTALGSGGLVGLSLGVISVPFLCDRP